MRRKDEMENLVAKKAPPDSGGVRNGKKSPASASAANKALITRNLRIAYAQDASEPLPQEWLDLLSKLDPKTEENS